MEKDEAIKILNGYMGGKIDPESTELYQAIELVVDILESKPSSNLDEAALKELQAYLPQGNGPDGICYFIAPQMLAMYKAGAEQMAGQFVLVGGEPTGWFRANNGSEYATGLDLEEPIKLPADFYVRKEVQP